MCVFGAFIYDAIADGKNRFIFKNFKESEFLISGLNFMGGSPFEIKKIGGKIRTKKKAKTKAKTKKKTIFGHRREEQGLKVFQNTKERRTRFASTSQREEKRATVENEARKKKENEPTKRRTHD